MTILATLVLNISIGGTLTPYAAPPVLMVTEKWGWDMSATQVSPLWVQLVSLIFVGLFIVFLVFVKFTESRQDKLKINESGLVGFFLAGLVVLGGLQSWWLEPIISRLSSSLLYVSAVALTFWFL
ncbi:MAG: hypothetical protein B7Y39_12355 [Bdellovibrio sp. 28-41-41]|nr:MAG: hypothetical protein B7Y39_12355 [Bdellovibrio sp. 28-41-41]